MLKKRIFRSFRREKVAPSDAEEEQAVLVKQGRIVLLEHEHEHENAEKRERASTSRDDAKKTRRSSPVTKKRRNSTRTVFMENKKKTLFVKVPVGLSEGNALIVVTPDESQKFPVKVPRGVKAGDSFPVQMPTPPEEEHREELSFEYLFNIVDHCLSPTPSLKDETNEEQQRKKRVEDETGHVGYAFENFFTPVPEVKAFYPFGGANA